ncbi:MAG: UMP kinase [Deltaproteobacteria bacterium]|nr:UMP kinase [Deltaproteobacteria bacterium]
MDTYKRVLLKLSGEVLAGEKKHGMDSDTVLRLCGEIQEILSINCQLGIVVGGGNFIRGISSEEHGVDRQRADYMGMIATYINALGLEGFLKKKGIEARIYGALNVEKVTDTWNRERILEDLKKRRVVIFAGGTGNPFFSTDTAAVLRASEIEAEAVLKATKVDGVFDKDPLSYKDAKFYSEISYWEALRMQLRVLDLTALTLAMERQIPIIVFNIKVSGNLKRVIMKEPIGTTIRA